MPSGSKRTIDWDAFGQRHSLNLDDLRRCSAAGLDPYTIQVGEALCDSFHFSQSGHRNLATTFDSLPGEHYHADDFEVGYGAYHVIHLILKTEDGFSLASVIGVLAEYFREDFVVEFLMEMARRTDIPDAYQPLQHQWRSLVDALYGILSTSTFGTLLSTFEDTLPVASGNVDVQALLNALYEMNSAAATGQRSVRIAARPDLPWMAAVASWLFDLQFVVRSPSEVFYTSNDDNIKAAQISFTLAESSEANGTQHAALSKSFETPITGGRVPFERFFRSCFGDTAVIVRDEILAAYIGCARNLFRDDLVQNKCGSQSPFLAQAGVVEGRANYALIESMLAWFPELKHLGPKLKRYDAMSKEESQARFDEAASTLQQQCHCSACIDIAITGSSAPFCKVSLAEVTFELGFYIRHMVVSPRLFPKRNGVLDFYHQRHTARLESSADKFISQTITRLASSVNMLQVSGLLFANCKPTQIDMQSTHLMGMTSTGLTVFLTGFEQSFEDEIKDDDERKLHVMVSPGWICLFGHEAKLEVYDPAYLGKTFEQQWELHIERPNELRQIMKWKGRIMHSSIVYKGSQEEKQAEKDGWILL